MRESVVFDHVRTPRGVGKKSGSLHSITSVDLAACVLNSIRDRNELDTRLIDDVILGCTLPMGEQSTNIARTAVLAAEYDVSVPGQQINRFCSSGLEAVNLAAGQVGSGQARLVIGGGVESMSRVSLEGDAGAWMTNPRLALDNYFVPQGIAADLLATLSGHSRKDVDQYAVESQLRAAHAWDSGRFSRSIAPVFDATGTEVLSRDEYLRPDTDLAKLASLKPSFSKMGEMVFDDIAIQRYPHLDRISHVHHAGNSSGIVDGASAVLVGDRAFGESLGLKARARILGFTSTGSDPTVMLTGPEFATAKVLANCGMSVGDIDLFEVNEAFSSVVLRYMEAMNIERNRVNVNGGAIAMGHPLGATGAMLLGIAMDELERCGLATALITLCVGAGMGTATIIERLE